jgi:hypothetical protein
VLSQLSYSPTGANESTVGLRACQLDRRARVRTIDRRRLFLYAMTPAPKWRNWQTRTTQNRVPVRVCGFDSHLRHQPRLTLPVQATEVAFNRVRSPGP